MMISWSRVAALALCLGAGISLYMFGPDGAHQPAAGLLGAALGLLGGGVRKSQ